MFDFSNDLKQTNYYLIRYKGVEKRKSSINQIRNGKTYGLKAIKQ